MVTKKWVRDDVAGSETQCGGLGSHNARAVRNGRCLRLRHRSYRGLRHWPWYRALCRLWYRVRLLGAFLGVANDNCWRGGLLHHCVVWTHEYRPTRCEGSCNGKWRLGWGGCRGLELGHDCRVARAGRGGWGQWWCGVRCDVRCGCKILRVVWYTQFCTQSLKPTKCFWSMCHCRPKHVAFQPRLRYRHGFLSKRKDARSPFRMRVRTVRPTPGPTRIQDCHGEHGIPLRRTTVLLPDERPTIPRSTPRRPEEAHCYINCCQ